MTQQNSSWCFWLMDDQFVSRKGYASKMKENDTVKTFIEFSNFVKSNPRSTCAYFRKGKTPFFEDSQNSYGHNLYYSSINHVDSLSRIEKKGILELPFVNGIYRTSKKLSIWTSEPDCNIIQEKLKARPQDFISFRMSSTQKQWHVGFIDGWDFRTFKECISSISEDKIIHQFKRNSDLNVRNTGSVIVLIPDNLSPSSRFRNHIDNRFVYCRAKMDLEEAEKIQFRYVLSLLLTINPNIPHLNLAFFSYDNDILELGVYLSGDPTIELPIDRKDRITYRWPEDYAGSVGRKLKEIILSQFPVNKEFKVIITNAIPSDAKHPTNQSYEWERSKRIFLSL